MYYGGGRSYGKSLSFNYTSDLSLSSLSPRNPSIQRVINTDYGSRDRSLSPSRDYSPSRGLSSPTFRRRDFGETERSATTSFSNDIDYSIKPRSYYDFPSTSSTMFSTYSSPIKKPKRTDYSDYFRPVLSTRPMLKSGYSPRSRNERDSVSTPLTRERKLIKFREVPDEVLEKIRRKISWDLPEEISSPLIDEIKQKYPEPIDDSATPEQSSSRRGSKDSIVSPISGSPRLSLSRRSSGDQTHDRPVRPPMRKNSRSNSLITSSIEEHFEMKQDHSKIPIPPPRKKSLTSSTKGKSSRKSSVDILLSEEKTQNYSKIAEDIRRNREIAERIRKLAEDYVDEDRQPSQEEIESSAENKSLPISKEIVVPDRSRRRRKVSIPEPDIIEEPPPEVRRRVRSRYRSGESSRSASPSAESKTKSNDTCEDETPRVTSRMHRKSVKYKSDVFPPRRSSKCTENFPNSTTAPIQEINSVDESKSNILVSEGKKDSGFISDKKDGMKTVSKPILNQKITAENKMKQEENQIKRSSDKTLTKLNIDERKVSSTTNKENEKCLGKHAEKIREKVKIDKEIGEKTSDKVFKIDKINNADQITSDMTSNTTVTKSKISENELKTIKSNSSSKITEIEEKKSNTKNSNKVIKDELKILNEKNSDIKMSGIEKKDRNISLDKNLKTSSDDACDSLLKKNALEVCSKTIDKVTKSNSKITDSKSFHAEEIPSSQEKCLNSISKYEKQEGRSQNVSLSDTKKVALKECLKENSKSPLQAESNDKDSKLKQTSVPANEVEEVVIVCKLPKKNELELKKIIPNEQNVVVSIKNSEIKAIESKSKSANSAVSYADKIIPTGSNEITRPQNCDMKKSPDTNKNEASDVNVTHTIVLKPKGPELNTSSKPKAGKDVHLKSIPDVIKSTVNFGSKENDISDVVKSTLPKIDDQTEKDKSLLLDKDKLTKKTHNKTANDMKKLEKLEPISEKASKDKLQLKQFAQENITAKKLDSLSKDLCGLKKSSSSVFETTKETLDSSNIKKSSSDILDDSKAVKPLAKPDLIQMTTNAVKKLEGSPNLTKSSINKEIDEKSSLKVETDITVIASDTSKCSNNANEQLNEINSIKTTSDIHKDVTNQSCSSEHIQSKNLEERKTEENNSVHRNITEPSTMKKIQKDAVSVRGKSESADIKPDVQISGTKTADRMKADKATSKITSFENTERTEQLKFNKEDLTNKIEDKNLVPKISDTKKLMESADYGKNIEMKNAFPDNKNVKHTITAYKKSLTLPNVNAALEECNKAIGKTMTDSNSTKKETSELSSVSTGDVSKVFSGKNALKSEKTELIKSKDGNDLKNSSQIDKKSLETQQLPKINLMKQDLIETSKQSETSKSDKSVSGKLIKESSNQDQIKLSNQCDENKNQIKLLPKLKNVDESKVSKSELLPKLNKAKDSNEIKIETNVENKGKLAEKSKETISHPIKTTGPSINSIQRTEMDKKILPPEILKFPAVQNSSKFIDSKEKETVLPQIQNKKSDTTEIPTGDSSIKNESNLPNISNENCTTNAKTLESKELDINSNNIDSTEKLDSNLNLNKSSEIFVQEAELKAAEEQAPKPTKNFVTSKANKIKQPKIPQYKRYGLFIRPKQPPKTILESSSSEEETTESETETESSSEDETPVTKKSNISNGRYPSRSSNDYTPKERSHSDTSNTSVNSTSSISTICTTIQEPWDDSPKKANQRLKFRTYGVDDFSFLKLLGKGSFGKVLLAELKDSKMYFAIKCLKKDVVLEDDDVESTMIERRVLALGTQHPYMCKLYCTFQTKSYLYFVMEYLNGGDLMFHIQENGRFEERRAAFYGAEIVSALKFLHRRGIVYRDIKLDNLMLDQQGHIRLVDFGMCQCRIYKEECMPSNFCGTPTYIAPEIVRGHKYNQSVDWWSFGVLLYEMLIGRSPFQGTDEDELFWSICNEEPYYPRFLSKEATHILGLLLVKSPSNRLGMASCPAGDIKDHAFFRDIDWNRVENKEIPPVFKPSVSGPCDTSNFDSSFTSDTPALSPVDSDVLKSMDQEQFNGFSYTNPHLTA